MENRKNSSSSWPWKRRSYSSVSAPSPPKISSTTSKPQEGSGAKSGIQRLASDSGIVHDERNNTPTANRVETVDSKIAKQQALVAEDAIKGWPKAEAEAARYKKLHEEAMVQKSETEEELRRCMQEIVELRMSIKEVESMAADMETRFVEMDSRLVEANAENQVLADSLQERELAMAELGDEKSSADAEIQTLYTKLSAVSQENSRLRYEIHLLKRERDIHNDEMNEYCSRKAAQIFHHRHDNLHNNNNNNNVCNVSRIESECRRLRELVHESPKNDNLNSHLELLRSAVSEIQAQNGTTSPANNGDAPVAGEPDEMSCAQSWASAMIAEIDQFRPKSKLLEPPAAVSSPASGFEGRRSLQEELEIHTADAKSRPGSRFYRSIAEIVKLVESMAHPLSISENKDAFEGINAELSRSDLRLRIQRLSGMKNKLLDFRGTVSWGVVEFMEELVTVLNRLLKISLYRNARSETENDFDFEDDVSDMSGLVSVSQQLGRGCDDHPQNSVAHHFVNSTPARPKQAEFTPKDGGGECESASQAKKPTKKVEDPSCSSSKQEEKERVTAKSSTSGRHGKKQQLMSFSKKHILSYSGSSSARPFDLTSKHVKAAIKSTISRVMTSSKQDQSAAKPVLLPHNAKPNNKFVTRLLSLGHA